MQVGTLAVQHIFEKDVSYLVPLYQRPYVWTEHDQWQPLWEDVRRIAEVLSAGGHPRAHFLGASVQDRPPVAPGEIETRLLIDGQQRLTTLQLLLKAFRDVVPGTEQKPYERAIDKLVRNNHPLSTKQHQSFKVWPTNADRDDYEQVMECSSRVELLKEYGVRTATKAVGRNIPDAYLYFCQVIQEWFIEEGETTLDRKVAALYSAIRDNVRLVVIDLDEKDDAQLIFETLNARGTPLLAADLVKNALLSEIQAGGGAAEAAYLNHWQPFDTEVSFWRSEVGRGHAKRARIEIFLQHALTLMTQEDVSAGHLYAAYRDFATGPKAGTPIERLSYLQRYGSIYRRLLEGHENSRICLFLDRLLTMDIGTAYPFLIKLFDLLGDDEERLLATVLDVESFLVRRMVCRLSTRGYNRIFVELTQTLETISENIPASVRAGLAKGTAEFDRWPTDEEFHKAWVDNPLYENLTRPRLRILLEAIEMGIRDKFAEAHDVPKNLTIEHVMPQTWEMFWPLPADVPEPEARARRNRLIHTIGNLTLLNNRLNPVQSNKAWITPNPDDPGKRDALQDHSVLFLNKKLCREDSWGESTVVTRSEALFPVAKATWPRPQ
jgi:Protein of unknown function DUF262/Protein of unknown function (DUF1524)